MAPLGARDPTRRLLGLVAGMFGLLALQNIAGIWINLYVKVTDTASFGGVYPAMFASLPGAVHTVLGVLIGVDAILLLLVTWRMSDRRLRLISGLVLALTGLAAYLGFHFVVSGGDNAYSLTMEMSFIGIVLSEVALLHLADRGRAEARPLPRPGTA